MAQKKLTLAQQRQIAMIQAQQAQQQQQGPQGQPPMKRGGAVKKKK